MPLIDEDRRRLLVSIHGFRSEGEWQEAFQEVFDPHFRVVPFKYGEFRHPVLAVLWIALEIWVILLGVAAGLLAGIFGWLTNWQSWVLASLIWLLVFMVANQLAEGRRNLVVDKFLKAIDDNLHNERNPHIIAHSLGSFIVGRMLQKYDHVDLAHVILMGCVLKPRYGWKNLLRRFEVVRNEVAGRDWVAATAFLLGAFVPEMGPAGVRGFRDSADLVRTLQGQNYGSHWRPCKEGCSCGFGEIESPDARVLNIRCDKLGHNDMARQRARFVWLPFLWNLPPKLHREFVVLCQECADLEARGMKVELGNKVHQLRGTCWYWTRGSLEDYIKVRLRVARGVMPSRAATTFTVRNLYQVVDRAARRNATAVQQVYLHPEFAVQVALIEPPPA